MNSEVTENNLIDNFADIKILQYEIPGFDELHINQKKLLYYLSQAALYGRDITMDQFGKYNLAVRQVLEKLYVNYTGDKKDKDFVALEIYLKRLWFSSGIHHHYSGDKFVPGFSVEFYDALIKATGEIDFGLGVDENQQVLEMVKKAIFDKDVLPKKLILDADKDLITNSAVNFYENVNQKEVEAFYDAMKDAADATPISYGLNSKVIKINNKVTEKVYKEGGMYSTAIEKINYWLEKALPLSETPEQKKSLKKLIAFYKTGDLRTWDEYNVEWVKDLNSLVDVVNGFIEVYDDPLGLKATWEAVVNFKNLEATKRTEIISSNAQWFEDRSPVDPRFRKKEVKGVAAKVITVVQLGGTCYPATPIGINLPNADWIRRDHGSKSVTLENITEAHFNSNLHSGLYEEFLADENEINLVTEYGYVTDNLHTDLHECLGHGSGQLLPGVGSDALKNYHSALEETRADLFALYYMADPKIIELGLLPNKDAVKAAYIDYFQNGMMTQLKRIDLGKNIEQAHMRCRKLICAWVYEHGVKEDVISRYKKDGKTYFRINSVDRMRSLMGELLGEVQRIKSEGDYEAGKALVEKYAIKVDPEFHKEVKARYDKLNQAPYTGFVNPVLVPVEKNGEIVDVKVEYPRDYVEQMLMYSEKYGVLPVIN